MRVKRRMTTKRTIAWLMCFLMIVTTINLPVLSTSVKADVEMDEAFMTCDAPIGYSESSGGQLIWRIYKLENGYQLVIEAESGYEDDLFIMNDYRRQSPFPLGLPGSNIGVDDTSFVTEIVIKARVKNIGDGVFSGQSRAKSITYEHPDDLKSIGYSSFNACSSLIDANIPSTVERIDTGAFDHCISMTTLELPSGIRELGGNVFYECESLTSVAIPANGYFTTIPDSLFQGCIRLNSVILPDYVTEIGNSAFRGCSALEGIALPTSLAYIAEGAFKESGITSISFPASVKTVDAEAFSKTKISSVTIPGTISTIKQAFVGCENLTTVTIENGVVDTESSFMQCTALKSISYPESIESFGCMSGCTKLETVTFADNPKITTLAYGAFSECSSLKNLVIPTSVTTFEDYIFSQCDGLTDITIPAQMTTIPVGAFYGCKNLKNVTIESGVTTINQWAFAECTSLTNVTIPKSVTEIYADDYGNSAFGISNQIPANLVIDCESDSAGANFAKDQGIKTTSNSHVHEYGQPTFTWTKFSSAKATFVCKKDKTHKEVVDATITNKITKKATTSAEGVRTYTAKVTFEGKDYTDTKTEAIPKLKEDAKSDDPKSEDEKNVEIVTDDNNETNATYVVTDTVKDEVTYYASKDENLTTLIVPTTIVIDNVTYKVTKIADNAFKGNKKLKKITIGSNIEVIGKNAFSGCTNLKTVKLGKNVTTIGDKAFYKCTALTKITIPAKVTKIGKSAFEGCKKLKKVTIKTAKLTAKKVGAKAFKGIAVVAKVKVPKEQLSAYKTILKKKGITGKKQAITK